MLAPDTSHTKHILFLLGYLEHEENQNFMIQEPFLKFLDRHLKACEDLTSLILEILEGLETPIKDCRGQIYENTSSMSGK